MTRLSVKPMPTAPNTIGSRLKQEMRKQGLTSTELARRSEVKTSFIYDVISGKSANPSTIKLARVAESLGVNLAYLAGYETSPTGGHAPDKPQNENHEHVTLASLSADGHSNDPALRKDTAPYQFSKSWISQDLQSSPENLRITTMRGDSMEPTLIHNDILLVDVTKTTPSPPGIFMLYDGFGLVAKRLEPVSDQQSAAVRVISDNGKYSTYECSLDEIRIIGRVIWFSREI